MFEFKGYKKLLVFFTKIARKLSLNFDFRFNKGELMFFAKTINTCMLVFCGILVLTLGLFSEATASFIQSYGLNLISIAAATGCGEKITPIETYDKIAYFSLAGGLGLVFLCTFLNSKKIQITLVVFAIIPLAIWGYVKFGVDYEQIRRVAFNYNVQAEGTLANIAEGQERYKSEHGNFINDLKKLRAHVAGSHGLDECVELLELKAYYDYWTASAKQVSSPEIIHWDSRKGSSLKKG
jgi:hypothetical protein